MDLIEQFTNAFDIYTKRAFPKGCPAETLQLKNLIQEQHNLEDLQTMDAMEHDGDRHVMRLGNELYPHMKLGFMLDNDQHLFFVDAHDSHFQLPSTHPGFEKLKSLRKKNAALKKEIELGLKEAGIPLFGYVKPVIKANGRELKQKMKVLIVDDEAKILDLLALILEKLGAEVVRAESVCEAKAQFECSHPDLVLCDIMMPEDSGYSLVQWLHKDGRDVPTYFVTGLAKEMVDRTDVVDVIQKPFSVNAISQLLSQQRT